MGAADGLCACFGQAKVLYLALLDQFLHGTCHIFDGYVRVNTVLIKQVDHIDLEPFERSFDSLLDVRGLAVQTRRTRPIIATAQIESELGRDHHLLAERSESFTNKFFVRIGAIDFGGVEERDAALDGGAEKRRHLLFVLGRPIRKAHSHTAEAESRHFQIAFSKSALLHGSHLL